MAREGTRLQTGHSKPRVITVPDTAPVIKRAPKVKPKKPAATGKTGATKGAKTTGVTKKKAPVKKEGTAKKVCSGDVLPEARIALPLVDSTDLSVLRSRPL